MFAGITEDKIGDVPTDDPAPAFYRQHACGNLHGIMNRMRNYEQTDDDVTILKRQLVTAEYIQSSGNFSDPQYTLRCQRSNRTDDLAARVHGWKILLGCSMQ